MTRAVAVAVAVVVTVAVAVAACGTRRPNAPDAPALDAPVELRTAHGELVLELARRGRTGWDVVRPDAPPLHVETRADAITVTQASDGRVLLELHAGPSGFAGKDLRLVVPTAHGNVRLLDGIGVTIFSADPAPSGGTLGRDPSGTPILEAKAERDRIVVERPAGGERLATVHHLGVGPDATLVAAVLGTDLVPLEARLAAATYLLSR